MSLARGNDGSGVHIVPDSPAVKRQKNGTGSYHDTSNSNSGYNSDNDSGDDLFDNVTFMPSPTRHVTQPTQIVARHQTQPTQIVERKENPKPHPLSSSPMRPGGEVQVPASSPYRPSPSLKRPADSPSQSTSQAAMGPWTYGSLGSQQSQSSPMVKTAPYRPSNAPPRKLGSAMAPAGTAFRRPNGVVTPHGLVKPVAKKEVKPIIIDLDDDDGPQYKGGSSDEGSSGMGGNIKPSSFGSKAKYPSFEESRAKMPESSLSNEALHTQQNGSSSSFSAIVQSARYDPMRSKVPDPVHRSRLDILTSKKQQQSKTQSRPARALPVDAPASHNDVDSDDELIWGHSEERMRKLNIVKGVLPNHSLRDCREALMKSNFHVEDAMNWLVTKEASRPVVISDDEDEIESPEHRPQPNMRAGVTNVASIRERYNQPARRPSTQNQAPTTPQPKPAKKRLVQGRKHASSPVPEPSPQKSEPIVLSDDGESDIEEKEEPEESPEFDGRLLHFLNTCKAAELVDLVNIKIEVAESFIAARPFKTLGAAEEFSDAKSTKTGKRSARLPVGTKIVQNATDMMSGYEAVDYVVEKCQRYGKPLAEEMAKWGFDVFGKGKEGGELDMTSIGSESDSQASSRGSGATSSKSRGDDEIRTTKNRKVTFLRQPAIMSKDITLKDYQLVGLNWLYLIYKHQLSCILADDMGLGKTAQVISFLSHLVEIGETGPHLVIVPSSVLENWMREFLNFSPNLLVEAYHGSQAERAEVAESILSRRSEVHVVVASYDNSRRPDDSKFLRHLRPSVCVFDEGHALKNPDSARYKTLMRVPAQMRILLTGTPLQNNLKELAAILAFILPDVFMDRKEDLDYIFKHKATTSDSDHAALLSKQRTQRARQMLIPFVLRRKKEQVLRHMPAKTCRIEYCELSESQAKIYNEFTSRTAELKRLRDAGIKSDEKGENNPIMQLRKAAIHPMLFRRHFTEAKLRQMLPLLKKNLPDEFKGRDDQIMGEMEYHTDFILHGWCVNTPCIRKFDTPDLAWMDSGKVEVLVKLLNEYKKNGDRVLVFSQFTMVLDVLESVLQTSFIKYSRIDGSTRVDERQTLIDQFRDDEEITCFLLSTGAGGQGINLMYANKVIIFDQSFNPQDDIQAENRAHRVGQTRDVEVVRLITRGTIEEPMYVLGQSKLALDNKVSGNEDDPKAGESFKKLMEDKVLEMLVEGKTSIDGEDIKSSDAKTEETTSKGSGNGSPSQPDVKSLHIDGNSSDVDEDDKEMLI